MSKLTSVSYTTTADNGNSTVVTITDLTNVDTESLEFALEVLVTATKEVSNG